MSSPFVIDNDRLCTEKRCEPFYVREWETMIIIGMMIVGVMYYMCTTGKNYFTNKKFTSEVVRANTQRMMTQLGDAQHYNDAANDVPNGMLPNDTIAKGTSIPLQGPSVEQFMDFQRVDDVDRLEPGESVPTHQPETSDDELYSLLAY